MGLQRSDMTEWLTLSNFKDPFLLIYWFCSSFQKALHKDLPPEIYLRLWVAIWPSSDQWNINKRKSLDTLPFQFSSVPQWCPNLCDPMDCSIPGFPTPTPGVYSNSCPSSQWCHPAISSSVVPFSSCLQSFPTSGSFPMSWLFTSGGQSIGASATASVLPMNFQDWFPLEWTFLISLQSKELSRVFYNPTVQNHQIFSAQFLYSPTLTSIHDY